METARAHARPDATREAEQRLGALMDRYQAPLFRFLAVVLVDARTGKPAEYFGTGPLVH